MDRRRVPPASTEEVDCWSQASKSLASLSNIYANPRSLETIGRVNRLISAWPTDDVLPAEGYDNLKTNYKRLFSALKEVRHINDEEVKAIDSVLEKLEVLIALRTAPESLSQEKRNKRPRPPSPSATATSVTPPLTSTTRPTTTQVTSSRSSTGPSPAIPFSREPKARREALAKQLPLQEGRKVAFHPPAGKAADGSAADADENTWILAVITKCINQDKNRYEVQDVEPQEDGQPGQCYNTTLRAIIPLPDPSALSTSAAHLNAYQEFPAGSTVMALYPDTSCFYRAEVISSPRDVPGRGTSTKTIAMYKLKFEDDDDQEHSVAAQSTMFLGRPTEIGFILNVFGTPDTRPTYDAFYGEFWRSYIYAAGHEVILPNTIMSIARQLLNEVRPFFRMLEEPFGRSAVAPIYQQHSLFDDPFFRSPAAIRPPVDVTEEGDKYIIEAELPGVKKENVDIRIGDAGRSVTIQGKSSSRQTNGESDTTAETTGENSAEGSKAVAKTDSGTHLAMERQYSGSATFIRTVWLPRPINSSQVSAKLQDGILTMTIPKAEDQESIKVPLE